MSTTIRPRDNQVPEPPSPEPPVPDPGDPLPPSGPPRPEDGVDETVARGDAPATPFLLLGSVALVVWGAAALVTLAALAAWWLV
jgi:hypothetical protein